MGFLADIEAIFLICGFLALHLNLGLATITHDYVHLKKLKILLLYLVRVSLIEVSKYTLELFL